MNDHSPIEVKIHCLENEMLESSRRILSISQETEHCGVETLDALSRQSEALARIDAGMNAIHDDMSQAQRYLSRLHRFCGLCHICSCCSPPAGDSDAWSKRDTYVKPVIVEQPRKSGQTEKVSGSDPVNAHLEQVGDVVLNLKNMANSMSVELDKQNKKIDVIIKKGEDNEQRIDWARKQTDDLI